MRLLLAAALALASASALGQDAPIGTKVDIGFAIPTVLSLAEACAKENDELACNALQRIQAIAECALNGLTGYACDQAITEAEAE